MKHFLLKFNHGVEIGARLAYLGHYARTKDERVKAIAQDELAHKEMLEWCLSEVQQKPSRLIDGLFSLIGNTVHWLCRYSPEGLLNWVARTLEVCTVFSYTKLAVRYPEWKHVFLEMADKEAEHQLYFDSLGSRQVLMVDTYGLEETMKHVTFEDKHIKLYNVIHKKESK